MPIEIIVPRLGWSMEEGAFVGWLKQEGEFVQAGEALFSIEGDKAVQEIESIDSGILRIAPDCPEPGGAVRVGAVLGCLISKAEAVHTKAVGPSSPQGSKQAKPRAMESPVARAAPRTEEPREIPRARPTAISPRALRAATELRVDWTSLTGSGRGGRIRERDVLAAAQGGIQPRPQPKTPFSLTDKVAIVTGAGSGIGAAIAQAFAAAGAIVYVADVNEAGATEQTLRLAKSGGRAFAATVNVADQASCEALVQRVLADHSRCDVLVNNAGVGHVGTILTTAPEDLARLWSVNVLGMYFLARAALPAMVERRCGSIINMASALGLTAMEDRFAYTVTKHAVVGLTRSMALDFGTSGVRINCICPGRVETPFVQARLAEYPDPEKFRAQMVASHAQKRMAQPWEIASAAVYLASDESAFVTGSTFAIDGGYLCGK
jgi:2-keto-3-deoxy-L-fuconate dehydrogenase